MQEPESLAPGPRLATVVSRYKLLLFIAAFGLVSVAAAKTLLLKSVQPMQPIQFETLATSPVTAPMITVDIEGAVTRPGVYQLPSDGRVEDAIKAAGGLTQEADAGRIDKTINRAAKVVDGGKLYFPKIGEASQTQSPKANTGVVSAQVAGASIISINSASQAELESLPGVGPVTAKKMIDNRPYLTLEELVSKKAVGESVFNKIKDSISL